MTDAWKLRFFTIWSGQALSRLGSRIVSFALIWWLTEKTGSEAVLATATMVTILPSVFIGPFAGTLVDRWSRRRVMIVSDGVIALCTAVLVYLYWSGNIEPWHLYGIMLARGLGDAFHGPAMMASTALMVPTKHLPRVGGMNQSLNGVMRIVAPPLGALLLKVLPMHLITSIDVVTAALAIGPLLFISIPRPAAPDGTDAGSSVLKEMIDGLKYVVGYRALFMVVFTCTLANVFLGPTTAFFPLLVAEVFRGGAVELGLLTSLNGFGIIAGGLFITAWGGFRRRLFTSATGWIGIGIGFICVLFIPASGFIGLSIIMAFVGFMIPVGCAPLEAYYQTCVAPDKQGRVFAVLGSIDRLTMPLGLVIGGAAGSAVPLRLWWGLVGASHFLLGVAWLFMPIIRAAEDKLPNTAPLPQEHP